MLRTLSLRRAEKKVIGLKGSSYHNQEVFDITNVNELIKIFGNNSIIILRLVRNRETIGPHTP